MVDAVSIAMHLCSLISINFTCLQSLIHTCMNVDSLHVFAYKQASIYSWHAQTRKSWKIPPQSFIQFTSYISSHQQYFCCPIFVWKVIISVWNHKSTPHYRASSVPPTGLKKHVSRQISVAHPLASQHTRPILPNNAGVSARNHNLCPDSWIHDLGGKNGN